MILLSRLIAALAYAGAAFLFGMTLGERGELGIVQQLFIWVIPIATSVLAIFSSQRGRPYVLLTGLAMFGGVLLGQRQFARAWDECLTRGYEVRDALVRFHAQHDGYPARLEELEGEVPCRCGLRKTILRYLSNDRGFRLWMTNDREVIVFTESPSAVLIEAPTESLSKPRPSPYRSPDRVLIEAPTESLSKPRPSPYRSPERSRGATFAATLNVHEARCPRGADPITQRRG